MTPSAQQLELMATLAAMLTEAGACPDDEATKRRALQLAIRTFASLLVHRAGFDGADVHAVMAAEGCAHLAIAGKQAELMQLAANITKESVN